MCTVKCKYSVVRKKVTVLLNTSLAWPAWAGCNWAELFSQPPTFLHNPEVPKFLAEKSRTVIKFLLKSNFPVTILVKKAHVPPNFADFLHNLVIRA